MSHRVSRDTIDDLPVARMSAAETESLLSELCVKLGFCLPPEARARIAANPATDIAELTNTVFVAEGLDPSTADRHLYRQVRALVAAAFQKGETRSSSASCLHLPPSREALDPGLGTSAAALDPRGSKRLIRFYGVGDPHGELSNFARYPILLDKKWWPTSEHYFQAQKFLDPKVRESIRTASTPMIAARLGRDRRQKLRGDWESTKVSVMREAVEAKFRQHDDLAKLLLSTGDATLVEHTDTDAFWGDGGDGSGKNMLGLILMEVRAVLQRERGPLA